MNGITRQNNRSSRPLSTAAIAALVLALTNNVGAQVAVDDDGNPFTTEFSPLDNGVEIENPSISGNMLLSSTDLETLVGPIALYPDDLLAIVLPASTYPLEIVQAARFLESVQLDSTLTPDEEWDDSIIALLNYPDVLNMMNEDIDWTWKLGEAVVDQQPEVISAIESFRDRAYAAGNLKSDEYQTVSVDDGVIEIEPVNEEIIYVPYYEPTQVVAYSPRPVYHYYPQAYPVYYYPYPRNHYFGSRLFWGVTTAFTIGWASDRLHVYHHSYNGHPYFGHNYYGSYWRRPSIHLYNNYYVNHHSYTRHDRHRSGDYWRPRNRSGSRPKSRVVRSDYNTANNRDHTRGRNERRAPVYRDQRTDGLAYNRGTGRRSQADRNARNADRSNSSRASGNRRRSTAATGERVNTTASNRVNRNSADRNEIRFRPRGDGAYTGTRVPRLQRSSTDNAKRNIERTLQRDRASRDASPNRVRSNDRQAAGTTARNTAKRNARSNRSRPAATSAASRTTARPVENNRSRNTARVSSARQTSQDRPRQNRASAPKQQQAARPQPSRPKSESKRPNRQSARSATTQRQSQSKRPNGGSKRSGNSERKRQ